MCYRKLAGRLGGGPVSFCDSLGTDWAVESLRTCSVEHVDSASIPDVLAKPILDLMLGLSNLDDGPGLATELAEFGYEFRPDAGLPAEHVYAKRTPRTHVLHVVEFRGEPWQWRLAFRDALRGQPELARAYQELSLRFADDRAADTTGKTEFVRGVVSARLSHTSFHSRA